MTNPNVYSNDRYIDSQPMLSAISVRQIYVFRLDDGSDRCVAMVMIGQNEVSSINSFGVEGQHVSKGDELGYFAFGGSGYAIIFDKEM